MSNHQTTASFIWTIADDILRDVFKQHEYGDVILPFIVLRRLDCLHASSKDKVIAANKEWNQKLNEEQLEPVLLRETGGLKFYNSSDFDLQRLSQDAKNIELNFNQYIDGYSKNIYDIIENFQLLSIVKRLVKNDILFIIVDRFTEINLHPKKVSNHEMGYIYEELLRRFSEMSNETAGHHYTPREVIRLMVNLLFCEEKYTLQGKGLITKIYDPACGTGGMLSIAKEHIINEINPDLNIKLFGQEKNEETYAVAKSDMLISGEDPNNIKVNSSFSKDGFIGKRFEYMLSNPPFGVSWKKEQNFIKEEASNPHGRFSMGLPRINDGAFLFLQHMISKMDTEVGSRIAIVFNGSPLFTGDAGGGESNIRKWIIENDWLEAIIALPTELFYNTGISTYIWIVTNKKPTKRKGKVQLINAQDFNKKMRKSLGSKRNEITDEQIQKITEIYQSFDNSEYSQVKNNNFFGYTKVSIEQPQKDDDGNTITDRNGNPKPDSKKRDYERVPLEQDIDDYYEREVKPHLPDSWMDRNKDKVGYEINFTKYFYKYKPLRSLEDITQDLMKLDEEIEGTMKEIFD